MMNIGEFDLNDLFLPDFLAPINNFQNLNDYTDDFQPEAPIKRPIKFLLSKREASSSPTLLQKKQIHPSKFGTTFSSSSSVNKSKEGRWTKDEQKRFAEAVLKYANDWKRIQEHVSSRNITQIRSHAQKFLMKLKENEFLKEKVLDLSAS